MMRTLRSLFPIVILVLVAAACSGDDSADTTAPAEPVAAETTVAAAPETTVETPETTTTAAATTTVAATTSAPPETTTSAADADGVEVTFETADGLVLEGREFGSGSTAVVLAHMRPANMESWFDFAEVLAGEGYSALAFNFRGYGNSEGDGFDVDTDVQAAIDFAAENGAEEVFVIGASMGGTGSVTASSQRPVAGTVTLSAPAAFEGADALAEASELSAPILLFAATADQPYPEDAAAMEAATPVPAEVVILSGSNHGTNMFLDHGEALTTKILEFLAG